jgi:hypothetical protein
MRSKALLPKTSSGTISSGSTTSSGSSAMASSLWRIDSRPRRFMASRRPGLERALDAGSGPA